MRVKCFETGTLVLLSGSTGARTRCLRVTIDIRCIGHALRHTPQILRPSRSCPVVTGLIEGRPRRLIMLIKTPENPSTAKAVEHDDDAADNISDRWRTQRRCK